jgi:threonine dehydrogenase-like Zn-dependent dehydrogenase
MNFRGVPGHEFIGVVERCGNKALEGKRVVGEINLSCGNCPYCKSGLRNHCPNRSVLGILGKDGAFADYVTFNRNLHRPGFVSDEAVFVEPLPRHLKYSNGQDGAEDRAASSETENWGYCGRLLL